MAVVDTKTQDERNTEALLETLAQLGGQRVQQDELRREGKELIIPETMTIPETVAFLNEWQEAMESTHSFSRIFNYRPPDVANALQGALKEIFGTAGIGRTIYSFFGPNRPELRTVKTGVTDTTQVPWGNLKLPMLQGTIHIGATKHKEYGVLGAISIDAPKKYAQHIEGLFIVIEKVLRERSIYKGKAIDGQDDPEFLDLHGIDPRMVIYSDLVMENLETNIWTYLRASELMRQMRVSLKRANLLFGPFGTGKTLAGMLTAQIAVKHDWTFLYCRPEKDNIMTVMQTARLYQPSVVFVEDVDTIAHGDDGALTRLLDVFDGITAKNTEIQVILTTNHPERIHKAMMRPGRLDSMTEIGALDEGGVRRMIEAHRPTGCELIDLDYRTIHKSMEGYLPAFVSEAIKRAIVKAAAREGQQPTTLVTGDFVAAANSLRDQYDRMNSASEGVKPPALEASLRRVIEKGVEGRMNGAQINDHEGDPVFQVQTKNGS